MKLRKQGRRRRRRRRRKKKRTMTVGCDGRHFRCCACLFPDAAWLAVVVMGEGFRPPPRGGTAARARTGSAAARRAPCSAWRSPSAESCCRTPVVATPGREGKERGQAGRDRKHQNVQ